MSAAAQHIRAAFDRFGVPISEAEAIYECDFAPREAILMLLANREIAARFDAAHARPPDESDVDALLEVYEALVRRG